METRAAIIGDTWDLTTSTTTAVRIKDLTHSGRSNFLPPTSGADCRDEILVTRGAQDLHCTQIHGSTDCHPSNRGCHEFGLVPRERLKEIGHNLAVMIDPCPPTRKMRTLFASLLS